MAQEQEQRQQPIKYGDVFLVSEEIANKPIAPLDAAAMQSAENQIMGQSQKGGPAALMQAAAAKNVRAGVTPQCSASDVGTDLGMNVTETIVDGQRFITQSIGDQDAATRLSDDKPVTIQDAERVIAAEVRNDPNLATNLGGVGESVAVAARMNQQKLN